MIVRFGTYTVYNGIEMALYEYYGHGLNQDIEEKHRVISYSSEHIQLEGFSFDVASNRFKKDILIKELKNAFFVMTKLIFNNDVFDVWTFNETTKRFTIYTTNDELGQTNNFIKLSDRYIYEIEISEVKKIWEERSLSIYDLSMPIDIEPIKELEIPLLQRHLSIGFS